MQVESITIHVSRKLNPQQYESADYGVTLTGKVEAGDAVEAVTDNLISTARSTLFNLMKPALETSHRITYMGEELGVDVQYVNDNKPADESPLPNLSNDIPF